MSVREFVVLGTASQVPTRHRNHNGYLLRWDGEGILFDPGEGTQRQMMLRRASPRTQITRICVTHFHGDHCLGLAGVIQRINLDRVPHPVTAHYPAQRRALLRAAAARHRLPRVGRSRQEPVARRRRGAGHDAPVHAGRAPRSRTRVESYGYRLAEPDGRTMLPERSPSRRHGPATSGGSSARASSRRRGHPRRRQRAPARAAVRVRHGHPPVRRASIALADGVRHAGHRVDVPRRRRPTGRATTAT